MWPTDKVDSTRRSNILSFKPFGLAISSSGLTVARTWFGKYEIPVHFDAVRVIMLSQQAGAIAGSKVIIATTETAATDSAANLFDCIQGGSAITALDSTTAKTGWRTVTFGGAATLPSMAGGSGTAPTAGVNNVGISDWIPLKSATRTDSTKNNALIMIRIYHDGTAGGSFSTVAASADAQPFAVPAARNQAMQFSASVSDCIASIATNPGVLAGSGSNHLPYMLQFRSRNRVISVISVGDSITQNNLSVADKQSSFGWRATADASNTSGVPAMHVNAGINSQDSSVFWPAGQSLMDLLAGGTATSLYGAYPDVAVYSAWSPNDISGAPTTLGTVQYKLQAMMARCAEFLSYCDKNRIWPVLWTGVPYGALSDATDAERQAYNTLLKAMSTKCTIVDISGAVVASAGVAHEAWNASYGSLASDGIHPIEAGVERMAVGALSPALTTLFQRLK